MHLGEFRGFKLAQALGVDLDRLRTALVELAWRLTNKTRRWRMLFERLKKRCGSKKAIVAVARRAWCVIVSLLTSGQAYRPIGEPTTG